MNRQTLLITCFTMLYLLSASASFAGSVIEPKLNLHETGVAQMLPSREFMILPSKNQPQLTVVKRPFVVLEKSSKFQGFQPNRKTEK